jgi:hypothetical protein
MKQFKLYLVLVLIAFVAFGCSKSPTETPTTTTTTPTTTALPTTQQTAAASVATTNITASINGVEDMASGLNTGSFSPKKGAKIPPTYWTAIADNWYLFSDTAFGYIDTIKVRFTPNIWASGPPYAKPTKIEYRYFWNQDTTYSGATCTNRLEYNGMAQRPDTTSIIVSGNYNYSYTYSYSSTVYSMNLSYLWSCTYDNVSTDRSSNKSGHYTYSCTYPFYDDANPAAGVSHTTLTGEMSFASNGDGNLGTAGDGYAGFCATNGTTFVKYYSLGTSRYYTLAGESFATPHAFTW